VFLGCLCIYFACMDCSLANKQDCEGALDELDIVERLNVEAVVNRHRCPTLVEMCSATAVKNSHRKLDPAIHNGFKWVVYIQKVTGDIHRTVIQYTLLLCSSLCIPLTEMTMFILAVVVVLYNVIIWQSAENCRATQVKNSYSPPV
jgi:hypothetical protein